MAIHTAIGSALLLGSAFVGLPSLLAFVLTSHKIKDWKLS